jgi:hypothetical protein
MQEWRDLDWKNSEISNRKKLTVLTGLPKYSFPKNSGPIKSASEDLSLYFYALIIDAAVTKQICML